MDTWNKATLRSLLPGGVVLAVVATMAGTGWLPLAQASVIFLYYACLFLGFLLAWRFHSSRIFFALLMLLLAERAISWLSIRHASAFSNQAAVHAVAILLPLNFALLSFERERGFTAAGIRTRLTFLFCECIAVAILSGVESGAPRPPHHVAGPSLPGYLWFIFGAAAIVLLTRFLLLRKPAESGLLWALGAFFLAVYSGGIGKAASAYFAAAAIVLALSMIEASYALAYHDELTTLPSRRAFNDALLRLQAPYSIAIVDIDHFKKFNDTYGHETGDEVLRLVAAKLARVTGGGDAYRCGGEEFSILFSGKTTSEVMEDLERLRATIESSSFCMRGTDRRRTPRGPDRRNQHPQRRISTGDAIRRLASSASESRSLSVTVSIGVANGLDDNTDTEQVIRQADKALYRAKSNGRNRVETATVARKRSRARAASIA